MRLNLQIIPFRGAPPDGAQLVLRPTSADDAEGDAENCPRCAGTGKLPRYGDQCPLCGGTGKGKFVPCLRWDITDAPAEQIEALLATLPPGTRRQNTIQLAEEGGGLTNTGHATIVAGLDGKPLPAVFGRAACGADHAVFYVHAALVVSYHQHRGMGAGSVSLIAITEHKIEQTLLWRFQDGTEEIDVVDRPNTSLEFPVAAVAAAREKARCYHCRSAHYAAGRYASGPSGALRGAGAAFGGLPSPLKVEEEMPPKVPGGGGEYDGE